MGKLLTSNSRNTAVLIIDMQDFFLAKFGKAVVEDLILDQSKIINWCFKTRTPIFIVQYKGRGEITASLKKVLKQNSLVSSVVKESNGGFTETNLEDLLNQKKIKNLVLMGVNGSACVQDTAIGALRRGFKIITGRGIIASATQNDKNLAVSKKWYSKNGKFFENVDSLLTKIN